MRGNKALSNTDKNHVANLDQAMERAVPTRSDTIVFRGVGDKAAVQLKPGTVFTDKGYVSTTFSSTLAGDFARQIGGERNRGTGKVLEIHIPKGSKVICVDEVLHVRSEMEVLLPRDSKFEIDGTSSRGNVIARYLGSQPSALKEIAL